MDADTAASVIDDAFEAFGTPGCRYLPPEGGGDPVEGLTLIRHRRSSDRERGGLAIGRGGFEATDRPQAIIVRRVEMGGVEPQGEGRFEMPLPDGGTARFRIGEDPVDDDIHGISLRCSVERLS